MQPDHRGAEYWKKNLRLIVFCLSVWAIVSYLCGVVFVEQLNAVRLGGYKLGFWFAQQGAIFSFVVLIFFYNWRVGKLDEGYRKSLSQSQESE